MEVKAHNENTRRKTLRIRWQENVVDGNRAMEKDEKELVEALPSKMGNKIR